MTRRTTTTRCIQTTEWLCGFARAGRPEADLRETLIQQFGTIECAMKELDRIFQANASALGGQRFEYANRKPRRGEEEWIANLTDEVDIRVWGGDLAMSRAFAFDFVNRDGAYIRTPPGFKIYGDFLGVTQEIVPIETAILVEQSPVFAAVAQWQLERLGAQEEVDPNWETYVVPEGTQLRIVTHPNDPDLIINIPIQNRDRRIVTFNRSIL